MLACGSLLISTSNLSRLIPDVPPPTTQPNRCLRRRTRQRPPCAARLLAMSGRASAIDWLKAEPAFREVASRLSSMVELQAMVAASYPQSPVTVLSLSEDGTLAVAARNAAEAARLRQLEPTVVARLRQRGAAVQRLRIRSRRTADAVSQAPSAKPRDPIPQNALQAFESLQAQAQSEVLRRALGSLLRHQRAQD